MPALLTAESPQPNEYPIEFYRVTFTHDTIDDNRSRWHTPKTNQIKRINFLPPRIGACLYFQLALPYQV